MGSSRRRIGRKGLGIVLFVVVTLGLVAPAAAEGSFYSYILGWSKGTASRNWEDRNTDSVSTRVASVL